MNADPTPPCFAVLDQYGALAVTGPEARAFLHGQLSNDIEHLQAGAVRRAGYCSPKGRLLANFVVVPTSDGFLLQVARDLAAPMAKRLAMFVLRSKVKVGDASDAWVQLGVWGPGSAAAAASAGLAVPADPMTAAESPNGIAVNLGGERFLVLGPADLEAAVAAQFSRADPQAWALAEIRAGLALVTLPTQDQFVPQMANFELVGGIDFKKGCYPGQEIVARTQYLGKLKRRMYRGTVETGAAPVPAPGQDIFGNEAQPIGVIVNAAPRPGGGYEFLAVLQSSSVEQAEPIRIGGSGGPTASLVPLPYAL